ncbi:hypothetical protein DI09_183p10 [Mitosporidium daphniae]|uniref:Exportin-1/Importin-beta-like domain-containing protein n=1 Tax=Mitosporidium daphniae TaxID=1485682 RepID=A0A098VTF0_9MICR|nr:uncharacterized protein DI09_183p10 [Mitosporidium daphniae]KGG52353.1 hypothetical protein DI09_183p10 [Mitosporidium daphniae]|eukprot:XP_013238789.1 uncharacterized protein DI09_183p10 [Mitosporidium daphniae]
MELVEALGLLYDAGGATTAAADRRAADRFLSRWQNTMDAWSGSMELISTQGLPAAYRLFGAQTLRRKLAFDASQLDVSNLQSLQASLAVTPGGPTSTRPFWIQIALCLSRLSLRLHGEGDSFSQTLKALADPEMVEEFLVSYPNALIEGTTTSEERAQAGALVDNHLATLPALVQGFSAERRVECMLNWIRAADGRRVLSMIREHALDEGAVAALIAGAVSAPIVSELLMEIILVLRDAGSEADAAHMGSLLAAAIPKLPKDDEIVEVFGLALIEFMDCFFELSLGLLGGTLWRDGLFGSLSPPSLRLADASLRLWDRLVDVARAANSTNAQNSYSINHAIQTSNYQQGHVVHGNSSPHKNGISANEVVVRGFALMVTVLQWPNGAMTRQEVDDFRSFRHVVGDGLKDLVIAALTLGVDLSTLLMLSSKSVSNSIMDARFAEAILTAARLVAGTVPDTSEEPIGSLIQQLPRLLADHPRGVSNERLWYAALLFISAYAPWTALRTERITRLGPFQLEAVLAVLAEDGGAPWGSLTFAAAAMALETLLANGVGTGAEEDPGRWVGPICALFRRHPRNERILGALAHLLVGAGLAAMLCELVASLWSAREIRSLELVLAIASERASAKDTLVPVLRSLASIIGEWNFESLNAGVLRSILLVALLLPESDALLLERLSIAILNLWASKVDAHPDSSSDSFVRRVAATRGVGHPALVALVSGMLRRLWSWGALVPSSMEAMVILLRSVMELLPEHIVGDPAFASAAVTWIAAWMGKCQAFDPDLVFECCQLLADIYFVAMDEEAPISLRQPLLAALQGDPSAVLIRAVVKVVICSTIFPYDMIPEISRLLLLVCEVLDSASALGSSSVRQSSSALASFSALGGALESAVHALPEAHFSGVEVAAFMGSIPALVTVMADRSLASSKRTSRLVAFFRSIHQTCRRRLSDDRDESELHN